VTLEELRADLRIILEEEDNLEVDWSRVEKLCFETIRRLNIEAEPRYPHDIVYHFLDDPDVRQKSPEYAVVQRQRLRDWLRN
jgi:hypothetical protein